MSPRVRRLLLAGAVLLVLLWAALPVVRAVLLLDTRGSSSGSVPTTGLEVRRVQFRASDGVRLRGWLVPASPRAPTIILIAGFKDDRVSMVPYARFLHAAGYNVLLYDSRGTGESDGQFSLGVREVNDVRGAVSYLEHRRDLPVHRYGLLGVSLGAGIAIVAAARIPSVRAVIADSGFVDQWATVDRLDRLRLGTLTVPFPPLARWTVDRLLGTSLSSFSPLRAVRRLAPRALLLIHSRHDANPTTPLSGARHLLHAARGPASLWIAPRGGHAGAHAAQPADYERRVLGFLSRNLQR